MGGKFVVFLKYTFKINRKNKKNKKIKKQKIYEEYEKHSGKPEMIAQLLYLQYVRQWPFYGSTFFVSCIDAPPKGYFEYRNETLYIAINAEGIHVIHKEKSVLFLFFFLSLFHSPSLKPLIDFDFLFEIETFLYFQL